MSIYSGFATRIQESNYNKVLSKLILHLQNCILEFIPKGLRFSLQKLTKYQKLIQKLITYQQHKYLPPKYSELFTPLIDKLNLQILRKQQIESRIHNQIQFQSLPVKQLQQFKEKIKTQRQSQSKSTNFRVKTLQQSNILSSRQLSHQEKRKCESNQKNFQSKNNIYKSFSFRADLKQELQNLDKKGSLQKQEMKLKAIIQNKREQFQRKGQIFIKFPSTKVKKQRKTSKNS